MHEGVSRLNEAIGELVEAKTKMRNMPCYDELPLLYLLVDHALKLNRHVVRLLTQEEATHATIARSCETSG